MALLSPISSEIMLLPLVTVRAPTRRQMPSTAALASSASRAKWTCPPLSPTFASQASM